MDGLWAAPILSRANPSGNGPVVASIEIGLAFPENRPKTAEYTIDLDPQTGRSVSQAVCSGVFLRDQGSIQYMAQSYEPVLNRLKTGLKPVYTGTGSEPVFFRKTGSGEI